MLDWAVPGVVSLDSAAACLQVWSVCRMEEAGVMGGSFLGQPGCWRLFW
jgi:hypothetical protein